jgi:N-acylglucosamine-6-phosphate 2-epimerase
MLDPRTMTQVALAAVEGGAAGIRAKGLDDLRNMRPEIEVPLIGLVKVSGHDVFITPTLADCLAVAEAGADVVALDGTRRTRPDGLTLAQTIRGLREQYPQVLAMADCGSAADAEAALSDGADLVGTTLAGYTGERPKTDGPDWELVDQVVALSDHPVFVEGRVHTPQQAAEAIRRGAWAVVVGTAITHPTTITGWFATAVRSVGPS